MPSKNNRKIFTLILFLVLALAIYLYPRLRPLPKTIDVITTDSPVFNQNQIFRMDLQLVDITTPINIVDLELSFDPSEAEVISLNTDDSLADIFLKASYDNILGEVKIIGLVPNPGYHAKQGLFVTIYFKPKNQDSISVKISPDSQILANDGKGTNIMRSGQIPTFFRTTTSLPAPSQADILGTHIKPLLSNYFLP